MRYRLFRNRALSAPKMTVSSDVSRRFRFIGGVMALAVAVAVGVVAGRFGAAPARAGVDQTIGRLMQENETLRERAAAVPPPPPVESQRIMETATIKELSGQIASLEAENARLKEDVAFFNAATAGRSTPGGTAGTAFDPGSIALRRFQLIVDPVTHRARYRLLVTQGAKASNDFVGTLQLVASVQRGSQSSQVVFPQAGTPGAATDASRYDVVFRSYKRLDGDLDLPTDAVLKSVEARILERGVVRVRMVATPERS